MKKIVMTLVAAIMMGSAAMAQDNNSQQPKQGKKRNKTEMAQKRTDDMAQRYGLNQEQTAQLLKLNTEYADKMGPHRGGPRPAGGRRPRFGGGGMMPGGGGMMPEGVEMMPGGGDFGDMGPVMDDEAKMRAARHKMREQMRANRQAYNAELKKILTDEQFQKYEADQAQRREHRRAHRPND